MVLLHRYQHQKGQRKLMGYNSKRLPESARCSMNLVWRNCRELQVSQTNPQSTNPRWLWCVSDHLGLCCETLRKIRKSKSAVFHFRNVSLEDTKVDTRGLEWPEGTTFSPFSLFSDWRFFSRRQVVPLHNTRFNRFQPNTYIVTRFKSCRQQMCSFWASWFFLFAANDKSINGYVSRVHVPNSRSLVSVETNQRKITVQNTSSWFCMSKVFISTAYETKKKCQKRPEVFCPGVPMVKDFNSGIRWGRSTKWPGKKNKVLFPWVHCKSGRLFQVSSKAKKINSSCPIHSEQNLRVSTCRFVSAQNTFAVYKFTRILSVLPSQNTKCHPDKKMLVLYRHYWKAITDSHGKREQKVVSGLLALNQCSCILPIVNLISYAALIQFEFLRFHWVLAQKWRKLWSIPSSRVSYENHTELWGNNWNTENLTGQIVHGCASGKGRKTQCVTVSQLKQCTWILSIQQWCRQIRSRPNFAFPV